MNGMNVGTLIERYLKNQEEGDLRRFSSIRANLNRLLLLVDAGTCPVYTLKSFDALLRGTKESILPSSARAIKSNLRAAVRWGFDSKLLSIDPARADELGIAPDEQFATWRAHPKALRVYRLLVAELAMAEVSLEAISPGFLQKFLAALPDRLKEWRPCWAAFAKRWKELAATGKVPAVPLPAPLSRRPSAYRIQEDELRPSMREELALVQSRLTPTSIADRNGSRPLKESTCDLAMEAVKRLLGYLAHARGVDLSLITLRDAMELNNARALIEFTTTRHRARTTSTAGEATGSGRHCAHGEYELGLLRQLATVAHRGLRDDLLRKQYHEEIRFVAGEIRGRRESAKHPGSIDDYFRVALRLAQDGARGLGQDRGRIAAATTIRDALLFALLASHGYRRKILTRIDLAKHVRASQDGTITICIPREETKPGLRDLQLELPRELVGLWRLYVERARPLLAGKRKKTERLFLAQGGKALSGAALYQVVTAKSLEILGRTLNPHQARKALATDHGLWSGGEFLSASAVLDSSPLTIQKHYADLQPRRRIGAFDSATKHHWEEIQGGKAA